MMIMATFAQWLAEQEGRPEEDLTGRLARLWKAAEGDRPRVSSPTGMQRWLLATQVEGGDEMIRTAVAEYHAKRGDLRVIGADESRITVMLEELLRRTEWIEGVLRMAFDLPEAEPSAWPPGQTAAVQYQGEDGQAVVEQLPMTAAAASAAAEARAITERVLAGQQPPATSAGGWQQLWETADHSADEDVAQ